MPIHEDVALVGMQLQRESAFGEVVGAAQVFESGERIAPGKNCAGVSAEAQALDSGALSQLRSGFVGVCG